MNFVIKNLGWILLLLFFVFMLFIISSSDPSNSKILTGSLASSGQENIVDSELEELVEKINESEEIVSDESRIKNEAVEKQGLKSRFMSLFQRKGEVSTTGKIDTSIEEPKDEESGEESGKKDDISKKIDDESMKENKNKEEELENDTEKKEGIISRIFSKKDSVDNDWEENEKDWKVSKDEEEKMEEENPQELENMEKSNGSSEDHIVVATTGVKTNRSNHIAKGTSNMNSEAHSRARKYAPEVLWANIHLPGVDLETAIGKSFQVGVHSLRINNSNFSQKLGYLMMGDTITQLTSENSYGCFMMRVDDSRVASSVGKEGYVCKKYLTETSDDTIVSGDPIVVEDTHSSVLSVETIDQESTTTELRTNIGDLIILSKHLPFAGTILAPGDTIDQMSEGANGCFTAHVFAAADASNKWKVGTVCELNLY